MFPANVISVYFFIHLWIGLYILQCIYNTADKQEVMVKIESLVSVAIRKAYLFGCYIKIKAAHVIQS